jgi:hypothetical protein
MGRRVFHPPVFDENGQFDPLGGGFQEIAFLAGSLEQGRPDPPPQQLRQNQSWKARA